MFHNLAARSSPPWPSPHFGLCHAFCKTRRLTYQLVGFHSWESKGTPPPGNSRPYSGLIEGIMVGSWPLNFLGEWRHWGGCSLDSHYPLHQGEYLDKRSRSSGSPVVLSKFFTKTCKFFPISLHSPLEDD